MNGIVYFQGLVHGEKTNFSEFKDQWLQVVTGQTPVSPRSFAPFLFNVAKVCGRNSTEDSFLQPKDAKLARREVLGSLSALVESPDIVGYQYRPIQITQILSAFGMLKVLPQQHFKKALIDQTHMNISTADPHLCAHFIKVFSELAIYPGDDWIRVWWDKTVECLDEMKDHWLDNIVYGLTVLDYLRGQEKRYKGTASPCREIVSGLLEIYRDKKSEFFPDRIIPRQIFHAALWYDFDLKMKGYTIGKETDSRSLDEQEFVDAFRMARVKLDEPHQTKLQHKFDISAQFNFVPMAVEIDGEPHMLHGQSDHSLYYDGNTRFQTALIEKTLPFGIKLIRVPTVFLQDVKTLKTPLIARAILDKVSTANGKPVVMHGLNNFQSTTLPECWKLSV